MFKMGRTMARKILAPGGGSSGAGGASNNNQDPLRDPMNSIQSNNNNNSNNEQVKVKTGDDINDFSKLEQDPRLPLNVRQVFKITKSWKAIARTMSKTGTAMFLNLFEQNQDLFYLFSRFQHLKGQDLHESMELREHAATVMSTLDQSINLLSDYDNFVAYLHSIGKMHRKVPGFKRAHFWKIEQPFLKAVKQTLDERCNETIEEIYKIAIKLIIETIAEGYGDDADDADDDDNNNNQNQDKTGGGGSSGNNNNNTNGNITSAKTTTTTTTTTTLNSNPMSGGGATAGRQRRIIVQDSAINQPGESTRSFQRNEKRSQNKKTNKKAKNMELSSEAAKKVKDLEEGGGTLDCEKLIEMTSNLMEQIRLDYHQDDAKSTTTTLRDTLFALSASGGRNKNDDSDINNNNNLIAKSETTMITTGRGHNEPPDESSQSGARISHRGLPAAANKVTGQGGLCVGGGGRDTLMSEGHLVPGEVVRRAKVGVSSRRCPLAPTGDQKQRLEGGGGRLDECMEQTARRSCPRPLKMDGNNLTATTTYQSRDDDHDDENRTNLEAREQNANEIWTYSLSSLSLSSPSSSSSKSACSHSSIAATRPLQIDRRLSSEKGSPISGSCAARKANEDNVRRARVDCCCPGDASGQEPEALQPPPQQKRPPIQPDRSNEMNTKRNKPMTSRIMAIGSGFGRLVTNWSHSKRHSAQQTRTTTTTSHTDCPSNSTLVVPVVDPAIHESGPVNDKVKDELKLADKSHRTSESEPKGTTNGNDQSGKQIKANSGLWRPSRKQTIFQLGGSNVHHEPVCPLSHQITTTNNNSASLSDHMDANRLIANEHNHHNKLPLGQPNNNEQSNINNPGKVIHKSKMAANRILAKASNHETRPGDSDEIIRMLILINKLLLALTSSERPMKTTSLMSTTLTPVAEVH